MTGKMIHKAVGMLVCFSICVSMRAQQYTVAGGQGTPLLAKNETSEKLEVYLLNGMERATISYTSSSSNHQWFKYKGKALEAEPIPCEQSGNTSTIRNPEEGCGYFVRESDRMTRYVWIIDYSRHAFQAEKIDVEGDCSGFWLKGSPQVLPIYYVLPASGRQQELKRQFEVAFNTLVWSDADKRFTPVAVSRIIEGDPYKVWINQKDTLPLTDTEVTLRGDLFARHFGQEKAITSETFRAVAVELHTDTVLVMDDAPNMVLGEGDQLSAPAKITFRAYANDPVATLFTWKIYRKEADGATDNPLVQYTGEEVDYLFTEAGDYIAEAKASDRTGTCEATSQQYVIAITESFLDVPNAFSPGTTPGINDEFRVAYKSLVSYKCWIFNRWGVQLFYSDNPAVGWDGKSKGKYVAPGVYFYVIEATGSKGEKYNKKGSINVLRPKTIQDEIIE